MSTISTSDSSVREQLTKEETWTDSCRRKRNDIIYNLRHHIQQKNREKATSLFKKSVLFKTNVSKYHKTFEASRKELYEWYSSRTEYSPVRRYSSSFKQKVINEVQSGKTKTYVAEKYHICYKTIMNWIEKAHEPTLERTKPLEKKKYHLDFKQKVVNEVQLGNCKSHVAEKYGLCYQTLSDWTKKACNLIPKIKKPEKRKKYSPDFKRKVVSEVCLGKRKSYVAEKYHICYRTLMDWIRRARLSAKPTPIVKEPLEKGKYPLEFKQKVVSEVCSGQHISQVCKNYNLCQSNLHIWLKQAYSPNFPYNSSAAWTDEP